MVDDLELTGKTSRNFHLFTIAARVYESNSLPLSICNTLPLPETLVPALYPAMQRVWPVVGCQLKCPSAQMELTASDAVRTASYNGPKVRLLILLQKRKGCL